MRALEGLGVEEARKWSPTEARCHMAVASGGGADYVPHPARCPQTVPNRYIGGPMEALTSEW